MERHNLKFKPRSVKINHYLSKNGNPIITGYTVYYDGCSIRRSLRSDTIDVEFYENPHLIGGKNRQSRQGIRVCGQNLIIASNPGAGRQNVDISSIDDQCYYTNKAIYRFTLAQFVVLFPREFIREFIYRARKLENAIKNNK